MKTPPLLFAAALLFWGWQTGYLVFALPMAAMLEATRLLRRRWEISPTDFYRVADLSALIFLAMFVVRFLADTGSMARWLPFCMLPLLLAQSLSTVGGVDLGAIFYIERRKEKKQQGGPRKTADVTWPAFILVLVAASAANVRSPAFYAGIFALVGWGLWSIRPPKRSAALWALALLCAGTIGFAGHVGLRGLHRMVDRMALQWYMSARVVRQNPLRNVTAIGMIGTLKRSNQIVMRVAAEGPLPDAGLLREASYSIYRGGRWIAADAGFSEVPPAGVQNAWRLATARHQGAAGELRVAMTLDEEKGFLALPMGTAVVENLPARKVEKNRFGAVRVQQASELLRYTARYGVVVQQDAPPGLLDLELPERQAPLVHRAADDLSLSGLSPGEALARIRTHFGKNFHYSLTQERRRWGVLPLEQFLFDTRAGHCEYFATATVFLLRAAGIPARYVVGYRAAEFSRLERRYLVRFRHAHAWAQAFVDGRWQIVDTTPAQWVALEEDAASAFEPVIDFFRWLGFQFKKWRHGGENAGFETVLLWLLVPLVLVLVWRIVFQKRASLLREKAASREHRIEDDTGATRLADIDNRLAEEGFARHTWETQLRRLQRLAGAGADPSAVSELKTILHLHYRDRYHPVGIENEKKKSLEEKIAAWKAAYDIPGRLFEPQQKGGRS